MEYVLDGRSVHLEHLSASEVRQELTRHTDETSPFLIGWGDGKTSFGDLYLWTQAGRALLELYEHREHSASDPEAVKATGLPDITFQDGLTVPYREAVPLSKAHAAVMFWLMTGRRDPRLTWD